MAKKAKRDIYPVFLPQGGCENQCIFCDQARITGRHSLPEPAAIEREIHGLPAGKRELAFYGGSFTRLPKERLLSYLEAGLSLKEAGKIHGLRCSTHPNAIDGAMAALLKRYGMDRVELGAQSLDDDVLHAAGRGHGRAEILRSIALLREAGIEVGIQLLLGLPRDAKEKSLASARALLAMPPDFVRLYPLIVLNETPLARAYKEGKYTPLAMAEAVAWAKELLAFFSYHGIPVIRIGLQSGGDLYRGSPEILAGPFHESFGSITKGALKLEQMRYLAAGETEAALAFLAPRADLPLLFG